MPQPSPPSGVEPTHRCANCTIGVALLQGRWRHVWGRGLIEQRRIVCIPKYLHTVAEPGEPLTARDKEISHAQLPHQAHPQ